MKPLIAFDFARLGREKVKCNQRPRSINISPSSTHSTTDAAYATISKLKRVSLGQEYGIRLAPFFHMSGIIKHTKGAL
eukprot:gene25961-biopygen12301